MTTAQVRDRASTDVTKRFTVSSESSPHRLLTSSRWSASLIRIFLLYAISGFVSLGYQIAWFRIFTDWFGSTNLTFALVVSNFIGGLAVGAVLSERITVFLCERTRLGERLRLYGLVELLVAATVMLTVFSSQRFACLCPVCLWA
jgi:spermidine synthase